MTAFYPNFTAGCCLTGTRTLSLSLSLNFEGGEKEISFRRSTTERRYVPTCLSYGEEIYLFFERGEGGQGRERILCLHASVWEIAGNETTHVARPAVNLCLEMINSLNDVSRDELDSLFTLTTCK